MRRSSPVSRRPGEPAVAPIGEGSLSPAPVVERVRARLRSTGVDPARDPDAAVRIALGEVRAHQDGVLAEGGERIEDESGLVRGVLAEVAGFGPLQPYFDDPTVEEVWWNGPDALWCSRGGSAERIPVAMTAAQLELIVERMLHPTGRRVDLSQPFVDASLPDGSRLHVAITGVTRSAWAVNVRKFLPGARSIDDLVARGALPDRLAHWLVEQVRAGCSILVSGATHAGKTTMLGALMTADAAVRRIVSVEETFELAIVGPDCVALQGRQPGLEGSGEISLRRLVREALRMRPDRIVIGEVRDAEALDLVLALNTGVPGAGTIHANTAEQALTKLATLPLLAGRNIDRGFLIPAIAQGVELVVHCERAADGRRFVGEVVRTTGDVREERIVTEHVYTADRR